MERAVLTLLSLASSSRAAGYYTQTLSQRCAQNVEVSLLTVPGFGHEPRCCDWSHGTDKGAEGGAEKGGCGEFKNERACTGSEGCGWYAGFGCFSQGDEKDGGGEKGEGDPCRQNKAKGSCALAEESCTWYDSYGCWSSGGKRSLKGEEGTSAAGLPAGWDSSEAVWEFMNRFTKRIDFLERSEIGDVVTSSVDDCPAAELGGKTRRAMESKANTCGDECALAELLAPQSCVDHAGETRCWFTYTPASLVRVDGARVPLVVDMHGGGGCSRNHAMSSGMKELADAHGAVVVWPQSARTEDGAALWQVAGLASGSGADSKASDAMTVDDIGFLKKLISATVAANTDTVDPTRIYVSGFSMGCMMSQRFAYDASEFVAAVGCHGGPLIAGAETAPEGLMPTSVIVVVGTEDTAWLEGAQRGVELFSSYFRCESTLTTNVPVGADDTEDDEDGDGGEGGPRCEFGRAQCLVAPGCRWRGSKRSGTCEVMPTDCAGETVKMWCNQRSVCRWVGSKKAGKCESKPTPSPVPASELCARKRTKKRCRGLRTVCAWTGPAKFKKGGRCQDLASITPSPTPSPTTKAPVTADTHCISANRKRCKRTKLRKKCRWKNGACRARN